MSSGVRVHIVKAWGRVSQNPGYTSDFRVAKEPWVSIRWPPPPNTCITSKHGHRWFVCCWGIAPRVLCKARQKLYQPSYISRPLLLIYKNFIWYYLCIYVCMIHVCGCGQACTTVHLRRSEGNFKDQLSPPTRGCGDWTQVIRPVRQALLPTESSCLPCCF